MKNILLATVLPLIAFSAPTEGAPAPAAEAETKAPKPRNEVQNDVSKPAAGTKTGRVWEIADAISAAAKRPALREEVMRQALDEGINKGTVATQYGRWTQFYGVTKDARAAARESLKPVPATTEE